MALLWSGLGHVHILAMVVVQLKLEELAKVVVKRHLKPEDCSGMTWAESAEVEDRRTLSYESVNQTRLGMPKGRQKLTSTKAGRRNL